MVIEGLRAIQREHGYLPTEELSALAQRLSVPLYSLQGVASFYPHFRLAPPPPLTIQVCRDFACRLRGAERARSSLESACAGRTGIVLEGVSCLGRCDEPTAIAVNGA